MRTKDWWPRIAVGLFLSEILLVLLSWVLSVVVPDWNLRSLLDGEGLRWLLAKHSELLASPLLVYMLLLSIAYGCITQSGVGRALLRMHNLSYRERIAMKHTIIVICIWVAILLFLAVGPNALMLAVDGAIYPSPFSAAFISLVALGLCVVASTFGVLSGRFDKLQDLYDASVVGVKMSAPLLVMYLLGAHLWYSILFVLNLIQ